MQLKSMKTLEEIKNILARHKAKLRKRYSVKELAVFGSCVKGMSKKGSDIDILVEFEKPIGFFDFLDLEERLEHLLGIKIDLVSKKALKPHIGKYILDEAIPI